MAKQKRITAHRSPQEPPLNLSRNPSRVELYARVSTSNGHQGPGMHWLNCASMLAAAVGRSPASTSIKVYPAQRNLGPS